MSFDDTIEAIKSWLSRYYGTVFTGNYFSPKYVAAIASRYNASFKLNVPTIVLKRSVVRNRRYSKAIRIALDYRMLGFTVYVIADKTNYRNLQRRFSFIGVGLITVDEAGVSVIQPAVISNNKKLASFLSARQTMSIKEVLEAVNISCQHT